MSTAGKVLSVLVTLALGLWLVLASTVATLNTNGARAVEANREALAKVEESLRETRLELARLKADTAFEQTETARDVTTLRIHVAETDRRLADVRESLERMNVQVAIAQQAAQTAEANRDQRNQDKADIQKELASNQAIVEQLMSDDAQLRQQRGQILEKLTALLDENRSLKSKVTSGGGSSRSAASTLR